jgi:hypothetical protein
MNENEKELITCGEPRYMDMLLLLNCLKSEDEEGY